MGTSSFSFTSSKLSEGAARLVVDLHQIAAQALLAHSDNITVGKANNGRLVNIFIAVLAEKLYMRTHGCDS